MQPFTGDTYIIVSRCSTEEQSREGYSHEYQYSGIKNSPIAKKWELNEVAYFKDTVTGTRFDNRGEGLEAAYRFCERHRGTVKYLFVQRWDRLGRDVLGCLQCVSRFKMVGVEINCPEKWIDYTDPNHIILLTLDFAIAQNESMKTSDRVRNGMHAALDAGFWLRRGIPPGYQRGEMVYMGKLRKVFVPNPETAPVVLDCFEQYTVGIGKIELHKKYGTILKMSKPHFCKMFHDIFYKGEVLVKAFKGEPAKIIRGQHEGIIPRDLWERCQKAQEDAGHGSTGKTWDSTSTGGDRNYFLKGVLRDAATGRRMTAYASKSKTGRYHHYYAIASRGGQIIALERAHGIVGNALEGFRLNPEAAGRIKAEVERQMNEQVAAASRDIREAETWIKKTNERLENITLAFADQQISASVFQNLKAKFEKDLFRYDQQKEFAEARVKNIDGMILKILSILGQIDTVFAASNREYKTAILKAIFPEGFAIDVKKGKIRTPRINSNLSAIYSFSDINELVLFSGYGDPGENNDMSGQRDSVRTHRKDPDIVTEDIIMSDKALLIQLFAA